MAEDTIGSNRLSQSDKTELQENFIDALTEEDYDSFCQTFTLQGGEWVTIKKGDDIYLDEVCDIVQSITSDPPETKPASVRKAKTLKKNVGKKVCTLGILLTWFCYTKHFALNTEAKAEAEAGCHEKFNRREWSAY